jgi:hypothetical protein
MQGGNMSKWQKGKVQWFDKSSGEGMVVGDNGEAYYVHYSTIVPLEKRPQTLSSKPRQRKNLDAGKEVKFTIYENLYSKSIEKVQQI